MRIIGGKHKGRKLKTFDGQDIRPTADRAKEALFNILSTSVMGADFLDLCAGTGSVGIEAYSRGANSVTFVDASNKSLALAKENAKSIGLIEEFVLSKAEDYVKRANKPFDIIFFDPPYAFNDIKLVLQGVLYNNLLKQGGIFIYERGKDKQPEEVTGFSLYQSRRYGIAVFDFYKTEGSL